MKGTVFFGDRADIFLPLKQTRPTNTSPVSDDRTRITLHGEYRHRLQEKEINMNSFFPAKSEERFSPKKMIYV